MKALLLEKQQSLRLLDVPVPATDEGEVLLRVAAAAVCRTDAKMWHSGQRDLRLPRILGHEVCGFIEGNRGGLYAVWPGTACGGCPACMSARENLCSGMQISGFHRDGGFAEFMAVPRSSLIAVPEGLDVSIAVLAEPLGCAVHAIRRSRVKAGERVLIFGAGTLGLLLALAAVDRGASVTMVDPDERKLGKSRTFRDRYGVAASPDPDGRERFDAVFNATSASETLARGVSRLDSGGRFCLFSGLGITPELPVGLIDELHYRELELLGAYGCRRDDMHEALRLQACHADELRFLIERRIGLEKVPRAMEEVLAGNGFRLVVDMMKEG